MSFTRAQLEHWYAEGSPDFRARRPANLDAKGAKVRDRLGKGMTKAERRFLDRLERQKRAGEIRQYRFVGHRRKLLKLAADNRHYNPDVYVIDRDGRRGFAEVKGGYIRPDSILKFDVGAALHPQYVFRMWQWKGGEWTEVRTRNA